MLSGLNEYVRELLKDESLLSPDTYLKRKEIRTLGEPVTYLTGQKDLLETQNDSRKKNLAARYQQELNLLKGFSVETVCPTCKRPVTTAELPAVQGALKAAISEIVSQGKEQTAQITELNELERKARETFEQFQADDIRTLEAEIGSLTVFDGSGDSSPNGADTLRQEIQVLTAELEFGNLSQKEVQYALSAEIG